MPPPRLILASASTRRQDLLREAGYAFESRPADIDEEAYPPHLRPSEIAEFLAGAKAFHVAAHASRDVILAADTVVTFGDRLLGKPLNADDACRMLQLLEGTTHIVITGVAVIHAVGGFSRTTRAFSAVRMRRLSGAEIDRYIRSNDWQGKAGGYGLQDADLFPADHPAAQPFVQCLSGSTSNVVGLPMERTRALLKEVGIEPDTGAAPFRND